MNRVVFISTLLLILIFGQISSFNKPFRIHLIDKEYRDEIENGLMQIGFVEVILKSGYNYHLITCQAIDSRLIKVVLGFRPGGRNSNSN